MHLQRRNRILRTSPAIREMVAETHLSAANLIAPLFIIEGENQLEEITSMPGYFRRSIDETITEIKVLYDLGIRSVLLFVKADDALKDNTGKESWNPNGLLQRSIKAIKAAVPEIYVMSDVALDPYSSFGHDGIVKDGEIVNDRTVEALVKMSLSHAVAGVDMVAPSDMMDGRVGAIREGLEDNGFHNVGIMSYAAKYASCFYGPFRNALDSAPGFGDKKTYQMDYRNAKEAIKEAEMDEAEGADILMVKPGLPYLDIVRQISDNTSLPVAVYHISGEYSMIKAAAEKGWIDEEKAIMESLFCIKRAGASLIATYFAKEAAVLMADF